MYVHGKFTVDLFVNITSRNYLSESVSLLRARSFRELLAHYVRPTVDPPRHTLLYCCRFRGPIPIPPQHRPLGSGGKDDPMLYYDLSL